MHFPFLAFDPIIEVDNYRTFSADQNHVGASSSIRLSSCVRRTTEKQVKACRCLPNDAVACATK